MRYALNFTAALRRAVAIAGLTACIAAAATAQTYPAKPIRLIVPYPAAGGSDLVARSVAQKLSEKLGQSVVVDNRGGATGMIGTEIAKFGKIVHEARIKLD
jgi:tripartite-type tricarboxylate transporter receptor subunit TctC